MKIKIISLIMLLISCSMLTNAEQTVQREQTPKSQITPQNITLENCIKYYNLTSQELFFLSISAINANNFKIEEIQSNDGYILFIANNKKYLATIAKVSSTKSLIKITPCDNIYVFPSGIITNIHKYIDLKLNSGTI